MVCNIIEEMMSKIADGATAGTLCNLLAKTVENPVALAITSETLIGFSDDFDREFIKEFTNSTQYMSEEEIEKMHASFSGFLNKGVPHTQAWPYLRHKQINCGCLYKDTLMGVLIIPLSNTSEKELDLTVIQNAAKCFGIWLAVSGYLTNKRAIAEQNFLIGLINENIDMDLHRRGLSYVAINNLEKMFLIWILPQFEKENFEYRIAALCKKVKTWWHAPYQNGFVILADIHSARHLPRLEKILEDEKARGCISDPYTDITATRKYLLSTIDVLDFCLRYGIQAPLISANDYKPVLAAAYSRQHLSLDVFTSQKLQAIIDYDRLHNAFYLETLRACFKCKRNIEEMADALNIHKNSVFYRINRMKELFEIDLDDPFQTISLFFALMVKDKLL